MIDRITTDQDWLDRLLPEGLPVPSSMIISGPGGSGKHLVSSIFLAACLRHGGSALVFLINSDRAYAESLLAMYGITPSEYQSQIAYVDFDPSSDSIEQTQPDLIKSNILKLDILRRSCSSKRWLIISCTAELRSRWLFCSKLPESKELSSSQKK